MSDSVYLTRANGAVKIPSRSEMESKPYLHRPYPAVRNHPDGRSVVVSSHEEDEALGEPWSSTPYPPIPVILPPPEPTIPELRVQLAELKATVATLAQELADCKASWVELAAMTAKSSSKKQHQVQKAE